MSDSPQAAVEMVAHDGRVERQIGDRPADRAWLLADVSMVVADENGGAVARGRSVAVDPGTHVVYMPLTDVGGHPILRELAPA